MRKSMRSLPDRFYKGTEEKRRACFKGIDLPLFVAVVLMALFGIVMVYSASSYTAKTLYQDEFFFVKKQIVGFIMGLAGMVGLSLYDCRKLISLRYVLLPISLVLLALVFVPGIGRSNYGATRWIGFGSVTIQPSEIAKYAFVLFFAGFVAKDPRRIRSVKGLLLLLAGGGAVCALIIMEPNLSVTLCIGMLMMALLFVGGAKLSHLICLIVPAIVALPLLIVAEPYRLKRLMAFLDPWANPQAEGYQLIQSLYALGNGGWFGTGLFASRQKYRFLPFAESDFILSIIGEELGYVGVIGFFCFVGFIVWRGIRVASRSNDVFSYLTGMGIILVYAIQVVVNALVVSGSIPPTGLPLPLVSAGNTSLIVTMCSFGILLSLSAPRSDQKENDHANDPSERKKQTRRDGAHSAVQERRSAHDGGLPADGGAGDADAAPDQGRFRHEAAPVRLVGRRTDG